MILISNILIFYKCLWQCLNAVALLLEIIYFDKPNTLLLLGTLFCSPATRKIYDYSDAQGLYVFPKWKQNKNKPNQDTIVCLLQTK